MESIALLVYDAKSQLTQGLTPTQVYELYTKRLVELQIQPEGIKLLQAEAADAIQTAWKEVRKKAIFARLKAELDVRNKEVK